GDGAVAAAARGGGEGARGGAAGAARGPAPARRTRPEDGGGRARGGGGGGPARGPRPPEAEGPRPRRPLRQGGAGGARGPQAQCRRGQRRPGAVGDPTGGDCPSYSVIPGLTASGHATGRTGRPVTGRGPAGRGQCRGTTAAASAPFRGSFPPPGRAGPPPHT